MVLVRLATAITRASKASFEQQIEQMTVILSYFQKDG